MFIIFVIIKPFSFTMHVQRNCLAIIKPFLEVESQPSDLIHLHGVYYTLARCKTVSEQFSKILKAGCCRSILFLGTALQTCLVTCVLTAEWIKAKWCKVFPRCLSWPPSLLSVPLGWSAWKCLSDAILATHPPWQATSPVAVGALRGPLFRNRCALNYWEGFKYRIRLHERGKDHRRIPRVWVQLPKKAQGMQIFRATRAVV